MKIVIIGGSGHYPQVLDAIRLDRELQLAGFASGSKDEGCENLAQNLHNEFNTQIYNNYITMLDKVNPDIAVVNPHFYLNASICKDIFERGIDCYCEKPIALTLKELYDLEESYKRSKVNFAAMFEYRCNPAFAAAFESISAGKIGEPLMVTTQKSYKLGQRPAFFTNRETYGGTIPWVGIHAIDWISWLSGQEITPEQSYQSCRYNNDLGELEVTALCNYKMENGGFAACNIDYLRPNAAPTHGDDRARVVGSKGIIEVLNEKAILLDANGEQELPLKKRKNLFQTFVDQVRGVAGCAVSAQDSFRSTEAALKSRDIADNAN